MSGESDHDGREEYDVTAAYMETSPVDYDSEYEEFTWRVPEDYDTFLEQRQRWPAVEAIVEWVFDMHGFELNRWSLAGFYAELAGHTLTVDAEVIRGAA